ncbi:hypothetical protein [Streptococcus orisratti]|uniref:hypothetical protein n=1 Tax=Streptococcus orisratti TaxID=114652 RepID=UPI003D024129
MVVTGLRFSEAMRIDLADIDRDNKLIHITKTYKVYGKSKGYATTPPLKFARCSNQPRNYQAVR